LIFITVGSQKIQFNRLLKEVDRLVEEKKITEEVFAQTGYSDYSPKNYNYKNFLDRDEFSNIMMSCDKVITHGGTGTIIGALKQGKKVIAVPRLKEFREHVDNHQLQIINEFKSMGFIESGENLEILSKVIKDVDNMEFKKYTSNTDNIINSIEEFIHKETFLKILMVGPHPYKVKGGMSTVIKNYYNSQLAKQSKIIPINTVVDGNKVTKLLCCLCSYIKMFMYLIFCNIHIVHVHVASRKSFYRKSLFIRLAHRFRKKIIIHVHGGEFDKFYWNESNSNQQKYITKILNYGDTIIALGEKWKTSISKYCDRNIEVIYNSIDSRSENSYDSSSKNIVFLGRLEEQKGVYDLIEAAEKVIAEEPDIKFILAGSSKDKKIEEILHNKGLKDNFILPGWINEEEIKKLFCNTMIFVLPSYNEGMPMSILEAMSFGIPIISTKVGSIPEIIQHGTNGILLQPGDVEMLGNSLLDLISNKDKRLFFSRENYKDANKKYSNIANYKKLNSLYER